MSVPVQSEAEGPVQSGAEGPGQSGAEGPVQSNATAAPSAPPADDLPDFLRFAPVLVRSRRDGWGAALQYRFVLALARGSGVDEAARRLGRSRQTAYALRGRKGAEGFAGAWDAAVEFAREARSAPALPGGSASDSLIETLFVPRFYRGRLIGFVQREDITGLKRRLGQLHRLAERMDTRSPRGN